MVYRWGGEEFIILLPETILTKAMLVCERIREHIQANMKVEQQSITISAGVTQLRDGESVQTLVQRADQFWRVKQFYSLRLALGIDGAVCPSTEKIRSVNSPYLSVEMMQKHFS